MQPRDADTLANIERVNALASSDNFTYNLMTWDDTGSARRQLTFDYVQVGATDATGSDAHQQFVAARRWDFHIGEFKGTLVNCRR
jgi:hypothetical protein